MREVLWGGCFGTLLIVPCLVSGAMIVWNVREGRLASSWPQAPGTLVQAHAAEAKRGLKTEFECKIQYRYEVNGIRYQGTRLQIAKYSYATRQAAERVLKPLAPGQAVTVYYQPTDPSFSVLRPGADLAQCALLPVLALPTLIGVGLLGTAIVNAFYRRPLGNAQVPIETSDDTLVEPIDSI